MAQVEGEVRTEELDAEHEARRQLALAQIRQYPDPVLRMKAPSVEKFDDDLKRLNLSRQRELKQLKDEFKDILDAGTPKPSVPAKKLEVPQPVLNQPSGSPDKGVGDKRVAPGSDKPAKPAAPTVKPEAKKPDPKKPAAKGGSR